MLEFLKCCEEKVLKLAYKIYHNQKTTQALKFIINKAHGNFEKLGNSKTQTT